MQRNPQRAQALENGELFDVSVVAREDTFVLPTEITRQAWFATLDRQHELTNWTMDIVTVNQVRQLLRYARREIKKRWREDLSRLTFEVPSIDQSTDTRVTTVVIASTTDDAGEPALTIGLPEEFGITSADDVASGATSR